MDLKSVHSVNCGWYRIMRPLPVSYDRGHCSASLFSWMYRPLMKPLRPSTVTAHQLPASSQSPMSTAVPAGRVRRDENCVPGPDRKLTLAVVLPGAARLGADTTMGMSESATIFNMVDSPPS